MAGHARFPLRPRPRPLHRAATRTGGAARVLAAVAGLAAMALAAPAASAAHLRRGGSLHAGLQPQPQTPADGQAGAGEDVRADSSDAGACSLTLASYATTVTAAEGVVLHGSLTCPAGAGGGGATVTLYQHEARVPGFGAVASAGTDPDGSYAFEVPALSANSAFYVCYGAGRRSAANARSARVAVKVLPLLTLVSSVPEGGQVLAGGARQARRARGHEVILSGTVGADAAGAGIVLQRQQPGGSWQRIATAVAADDGEYSFTRAFRIPEEVSVRVLARHPGQRVAASEPVSFVVVRRQNPRLTITSSAARVAFGQPVTISGVLAGAHEAPVTLLARTHGSGFREVDHATTDGSGAYAFTQMPLASMGYLVASGRVRSVALFQAVSFALGASASSTSIVAGESVTFSGSLAPAVAGAIVYLQRQDTSGAGWHTVESASTAADGSYSITHLAADAQTAVFRVRVPRDQRIEGAASHSFTIEARPHDA
jgi:hypothetical protein